MKSFKNGKIRLFYAEGDRLKSRSFNDAVENLTAEQVQQFKQAIQLLTAEDIVESSVVHEYSYA